MEQFTPVDPDFYDILETITSSENELNIFYFEQDGSLGQIKGTFDCLSENNTGEYILFKEKHAVRIDRVITINGKPGPAFDEYDAFANACLSCQAGYDN